MTKRRRNKIVPLKARSKKLLPSQNSKNRDKPNINLATNPTSSSGDDDNSSRLFELLPGDNQASVESLKVSLC